MQGVWLLLRQCLETGRFSEVAEDRLVCLSMKIDKDVE